jgi:hypothetical protein
MVSKWFMGAVSAAGLAAGFSVSAYTSSVPKAHSTVYAEAEALYHKEVALGNREQELQFLLKLRTAQVDAAAHPVAAAPPQTAVTPSRPPATPAVAQASQRIAPATTTTTIAAPPPPESEPSPPTTTTTPAPTTTTTVATTTTTTTSPGSDDGLPGGVDH